MTSRHARPGNGAVPHRTFVLRRPVLCASRETVAFQLVYRTGRQSATDAGAQATRTVADLASFTGLEPLAGGRKAFVPVTRDVLLDELPRLIPPGLAIVDVGASDEADDVVVGRCKKLASVGYAIAVDLVPGVSSALREVAQVLKIDAKHRSPEETSRLVESGTTEGCRTFVHGISSWDAFDGYVAAGADYLSGDFLTTARALVRTDLPAAQLSCMRVVVEVSRPDLDVDELEETIERHDSLTHELLRHINASHMGTRQAITSLRDALVMLGRGELRRRVALVALTSVVGDELPELVTEGLVRARFAEILAAYVGLGERDQEMFLVGLLSILEALCDCPIGKIIESLPLSRDVQTAFTAPADSPLGPLLYAVLAYARGNWSSFDLFCERSGLDPGVAPKCYHEAVQWTRRSMESAGERAA